TGAALSKSGNLGQSRRADWTIIKGGDDGGVHDGHGDDGNSRCNTTADNGRNRSLRQGLRKPARVRLPLAPTHAPPPQYIWRRRDPSDTKSASPIRPTLWW